MSNANPLLFTLHPNSSQTNFPNPSFYDDQKKGSTQFAFSSSCLNSFTSPTIIMTIVVMFVKKYAGSSERLVVVLEDWK